MMCRLAQNSRIRFAPYLAEAVKVFALIEMAVAALRGPSGAKQSATNMSTVTEDRMALVALAEKHADGDFVCKRGHDKHHRLTERDVQSIFMVARAIAQI